MRKNTPTRRVPGATVPEDTVPEDTVTEDTRTPRQESAKSQKVLDDTHTAQQDNPESQKMSQDDREQPETPDKDMLWNTEMETVIEEREFLLRTTRSEFSSDEYKTLNKYQNAFSHEAVYYTLLVQNQYVTKVAEEARVRHPNVLPPLKSKKVDGVEMTVHPFAKHDYELSISTNYCISKRLLDPRELAPLEEGEEDPEERVDMNSQKLHSSVKMGFCVYASEKNEFRTGGTKYTFLGGEGTCDVAPELLTDKSELRKHRRVNLYRYQTNEPPDFGLTAKDANRHDISMDKKAQNIEVSSKLLQFQPRSLGYPLFDTPFKAKASLDAVRLDEQGLPDLSDARNESKYHVAMRFRFEVMRLWWKLFHHQQDEVSGLIKLLSFNREIFGGSQSIVEDLVDSAEGMVDLIDSTKPAMILAVTELGKTGMLDPGKIWPKYKEASEKFNGVSNRNLFELFNDPEDSNPPRVKDADEQRFTEPVQLYGSDTWPIVKAGMNGAWLDWVGVKGGIQKRNMQAFSLMEAIFDDDLAVDYDTVFTKPTKTMDKYESDVFGIVFPEEKYRRAQFWNTFSVISGDMMESMPFWANAYLCDDLVTPTAEQDSVVAERVAILQAQFEDKDMKLKLMMESLDKMSTNTSQHIEAKLYQERSVYFARVKRAAKLEELKTLTMHGASSSVVWRPYSSNLQTERSKNDAEAPHCKSWAQECLHRSILTVYSADWKYEYYSVDKGTGISMQSQRSLDGIPFSLMEGESESADFFRQWYDEVYSNKGDDGLALPGHLVIMNNLVDGGKPTLTHLPGTVQLQGHVARIVSRTRRYGPRPNPDEREGPGNLPVALFPPYNYLLETQFEFIGAGITAARQNNEASSSNKIMVNLTDEHIMPFSYRSQYRYGDAVELRPIDLNKIKISEERKRKYYRTFGYNEGKADSEKWIIADVPFLGPPSVLSASLEDGGLGWGDFNLDDPSRSYLDAPPEHRAVIATLGSLVLTAHDPKLYKKLQEEPLRNVKNYMRWPIAPIEVEGRTYITIGPFSNVLKDEDVPEEIAAIKVYRDGTSGRKLRYSSFTLFKWTSLPHQKAETDKDAPDQYKFDGLYHTC